MRRTLTSIALAAILLVGCNDGRARYATTDSPLKLDRVVLYRNGIGYFERTGDVDGDMLTIKVRKDQVNDLLKSLTVVDRATGKAVSVSMPLDPQTWANAAIATLAPGRGNLAQVLDALRGTRVTLSTTEGSVTGRITLVEEIFDQPEEPEPRPYAQQPIAPPRKATDHRVTVIDGDEMKVVLLSKVRGITLEDGDLAMQLNRTLDASAGEGMYQQVEVAIRLTGKSSHKLSVSYVVAAPMWKPTYRVVLPKDRKGKALLQGWAVVDNTSGEEWSDISLGLTSGAPIAFRYDLHTPRDVERSDLTESGVRRQATAMMGESTFEDQKPTAEPPPPPPAEPATGMAAATPTDDAPMAKAEAGPSGGGLGRSKSAPGKRAGDAKEVAKDKSGKAGESLREEQRAFDGRLSKGDVDHDGILDSRDAIDFDSLRRSTLAQAHTASVSGLTRFDIDSRVTVPEGTSTMVAIINAEVEGEETFLYRPGGAGMGYEANPYRVVRFKNATPFVLEPGPISIYAGGSFVGEGLSDTVSTNTSATVPFAVEPGIMVTTGSKFDGDEMRLVKISRGVLEVESFGRKVTTYSVKAQTMQDGFDVLVRHPKAGWNYELKDRPEGTEDLPDAYLVKVKVEKGKREGAISVTEQTPSKREISIWDSPALPLLEKLIVAAELTPETRAKLQPIVDRRRDIGKIDEQLDGLRRQRDVNDQRANETRQNLESIQKDQAASGLRQKLTKRLEDFSNEGNRLGRDMAELERQRLEKRIELEDMLQDLEILAPAPKKGAAGAAAAAPTAPSSDAATSAGAAPSAPSPAPSMTTAKPTPPKPAPAPKKNGGGAPPLAPAPKSPADTKPKAPAPKK